MQHDLKKDGLNLLKKMDMSQPTNYLGGDDGIAVAYALALFGQYRSYIRHWKCWITVDEEIGLLGAVGLDRSVLAR